MVQELELAQAAMRADGPLDGCHALHERGHRLDHCGLWLGRTEGVTGCSQMSAFVRWAEQAVVANALEPAGQHMLQEALDELGAEQA